jgi:hypothetical protein
MPLRPMQFQVRLERVDGRLKRVLVFDPRLAMDQRAQLNQGDILMVRMLTRLFPGSDAGRPGMAQREGEIGPQQRRDVVR